MRTFLILNSCVSLAALGWCAKLHSDSNRLFTAAKMLVKRSENDREKAEKANIKINLATVGSVQTSKDLDDVKVSLMHLSALLVEKGITWNPPKLE